MRVTREKHFNYMLKLSPILGLAYMVESWICVSYFPEAHTIDVLKMVGMILSLMIAGFIFYDRFHEITLHPNSIEICFPPLDYHEEFSFREIQEVKIITNRFSLSDVILYLHDDTIIRLRHVDRGELIRDHLLGLKRLPS